MSYKVLNAKQLGDKIKAIRKSHNHSKQELADQIVNRHNESVSAGVIKHWEDGRVMPRFASIVQICNIYQLDINTFL